MHTLEIRRHTHRHIPQPHLSQIGVDLARRAGEGLGRFDRVMTSTAPRAFETAIAMGYAVDEQIEQLGMLSDAVTAAMQWNAGYTAWMKAAHNSPVVAQYTQALAGVLRSTVHALPDGGHALIISHGGIVEASVIGCLTAGTRLTFDGEAVVNVEMLRVDQPR